MITKINIQGYRIYKDFVLHPNPKLNLIVGANESGKSTLIEAISLALTGRINGRKASEELNPYWFNSILAVFVNVVVPIFMRLFVEESVSDRARGRLAKRHR